MFSLVPLFFFSALIGSPVVGFLVFIFLGLWQSLKALTLGPNQTAMTWTREDWVLSLCFMSIPLFKLLSLLWSSDPRLALANVGWHLYLLFWPLALAGLARCRTPLPVLDRAVAGGIVFYTLMAFAVVTVAGHQNTSVLGGTGLTSQLLMLLGAWNLLALTRSRENRWLLSSAFVATWIGLVLAYRRQELLGFAVLTLSILLYRFRRVLRTWQLLLLLALVVLGIGLAISFRWEKFALGFAEIQHYFASREQGLPFVDNSWGARLEMWRLGWHGFMESPWVGLGASVRPYTMPDAPAIEIFRHRHFHSHLLQTLVEGGLLGLLVSAIALTYSSLLLIVRAYARHKEYALLAAAMLGAYVMEGTVSAALQYDKPNAFLVVASAWLWLQIRSVPNDVGKMH